MTPSYILIYVDKPQASAAFYERLLGRTPVENSPTFVLFVFENGLKFGLWSRHTAEPAVTAAAGGAEIAFPVPADQLEPLFAEWTAQGVDIAQPLTAMDFGRTFVGLDPDGHRLRVFTPA